MPVTRRDFTRLAAASVATQLLPSALTPFAGAQQSSQVGYCIVGLGRISMDHFMPGVKMAQASRITGLVSGHRDKAERMAAQYGVPGESIYSYENYDDIRNNPNIHAVYIALPNSMHAEYTIRAARAGKHVLCEKPMATSVADAKAMIAACKEASRQLMIAYRCQYEPSNLRAIQLIREGKLGEVQAIESANGFNINPGEWRLNRKLAGGGPLMDVGIYSINAARYLTGEEPEHVEGYSSVTHRDARFHEVEENVSWSMRFPSGIVASCNTTYGAQMNGYYRVHGSKGVLNLEPAFAYQGQHLTCKLDQGPLDEPNELRDPSQFARMADVFSGCVRDNKPPKTDGEEGLRDMQWMETIYRSAGLSL